jgi:nitrite reductase (NADH) small subunit
MTGYLIGEESDFGDGDKCLLLVDNVEVGVFRVSGDIFAWRNICPHRGGPVCQGQVFRRVMDVFDDTGGTRGRRYHETDVNIVCPWHGAEFDIRTGRHAGTEHLRLNPVGIERRDGLVYVHVDNRNK